MVVDDVIRTQGVFQAPTNQNRSSDHIRLLRSGETLGRYPREHARHRGLAEGGYGYLSA
jgi:hypothetical protein